MTAGLACAVALAGLPACSSDPYADYCDTVSGAQDPLAAAVASDSPTALVDVLGVLQDLRDASPDDVVADWQYLVGRVQALSDALDAAVDGTGTAPEDLDVDDPPEGVSDADLDAVRAAARQLASSDAASALSTVEAEVRAVCGTSLTGT
ncbi:hypothetical protein [Nocardioides sp. GY 10127]|uniref:hypothetical protein n=1 Tax=Nocardioides sp. GY 10127 TaxID=2569762 RepID=UPI0010A789D0|nr:hypothetical protein [Nocardioides sp. GY 10127]TIC85456.1 hypothetical protein E8D37_02115 [Nocardioides sp. GY 10127]